MIVVADGSCGDSCSVLGISSEYTVESCNAYGANATIERLDQRQVLTHTHTHTQGLTSVAIRLLFVQGLNAIVTGYCRTRL